MNFRREGNRFLPEEVDLDELARAVERPSDLAKLWSRAKGHKVGYVRPLTVQQRSQLKQLIAACGGPQAAASAMLGAIRSWGPFASRCEAQAGIYKAPTRPHIGFLLKHAETAMNMLHVEQAPDLQVAAVGRPRRHVEQAQEEMTAEERRAYLDAITGEDG